MEVLPPKMNGTHHIMRISVYTSIHQKILTVIP